MITDCRFRGPRLTAHATNAQNKIFEDTWLDLDLADGSGSTLMSVDCRAREMKNIYLYDTSVQNESPALLRQMSWSHAVANAILVHFNLFFSIRACEEHFHLWFMSFDSFDFWAWAGVADKPAFSENLPVNPSLLACSLMIWNLNRFWSWPVFESWGKPLKLSWCPDRCAERKLRIGYDFAISWRVVSEARLGERATISDVQWDLQTSELFSRPDNWRR